MCINKNFQIKCNCTESSVQLMYMCYDSALFSHGRIHTNGCENKYKYRALLELCLRFSQTPTVVLKTNVWTQGPWPEGPCPFTLNATLYQTHVYKNIQRLDTTVRRPDVCPGIGRRRRPPSPYSALFIPSCTQLFWPNIEAKAPSHTRALGVDPMG